jgi:hypothetical protein
MANGTYILRYWILDAGYRILAIQYPASRSVLLGNSCRRYKILVQKVAGQHL